ncbi:hypothetical protein PHLCEN_2v13315 [Hermanssonia centrifuga]|uniref:Uncharacterized protein n=1 Tax=Hermanssonia centrifuga TaxID=98765 RepID=A0A2R6NEI9_9APHY|nr:hypothetical protein PHLCEN_2v13315 [Hermanssonia centrifuga]
MEGHGPGYAVENQMNQGYRQILSLISGGASLPRLTGLGSEDKPGGKDSVSLVVLKENEIQGALRLFCRIGMVAQFRQTTYDLASAGWRDLCRPPNLESK